MANIISIATAVPDYCHRQQDILQFMQQAYDLNETDQRKLSSLYNRSGIGQRYSVIADYGLPEQEWTFLPCENNVFPGIEKRMAIYKKEALPLSLKAIRQCISGHISASAVTHLITVSCTGMSAPGLDLEIVEALQLSPNIFRTSVNFMGCYAAIHALKLGKLICDSDAAAHVLIVSTELCTLHFQQEFTLDNAASSLLFADGSAAILLSSSLQPAVHLSLDHFHAAIAFRGKQDMAWELSSKGFLMTLSGYIPQLIEEDIAVLVHEALQKQGLTQQDITHWCIHPGGRKIVDAIQQQLHLTDEDLAFSRKILHSYGNMSSPTILFVLKEMMDALQANEEARIFGVAFGPGLTMETFIATAS